MKKVLSVILVFVFALCFTSCDSSLIDKLNGTAKAEYIEAARQALDIIQESGAELANCSNLYLDVWHNAIYKEKDERTNPYAMENGKFVADFDTALTKLYEDEEFKSRLDALEKNQNQLRKLRLIIKEPPKGAEKFNPSLLGMIDSFIEYSCVVLECTGSYYENLEAIHNLDKQFGEYMREFSAYEDVIKDFVA